MARVYRCIDCEDDPILDEDKIVTRPAATVVYANCARRCLYHADKHTVRMKFSNYGNLNKPASEYDEDDLP